MTNKQISVDFENVIKGIGYYVGKNSDLLNVTNNGARAHTHRIDGTHTHTHTHTLSLSLSEHRVHRLRKT
jgi:hypothetical protein